MRIIGGRRYLLPVPSLRGHVVATLIVAGGILERVHFRAFALWARIVGRLAEPSQTCRVTLGGDLEFEFLLADFYWNRLLSSFYKYEPEIDALLWSLRNSEYRMLDCGANFGWWSVVSSSAAYGSHEVVAVEALASTYARLVRNRQVNDGRFRTIHAAVDAQSGLVATLYKRGSHAGTSLLPQWLGNDRPLTHVEAVPTVSIDELAARWQLDPATLIIKLDVEGVEVRALQGATNALRGGALVIYEDSGEDPESAVTRSVLGELGLAVYRYDELGRVRRIADPSELRRLKRSKKRGYNLLATVHGSDFDDWLREAAARHQGADGW